MSRPPVAAAPGFHFGDLYAVGLLVGGIALLLAVVALSRERGRAFTSATVYLFMGAAISIGLHALDVDLIDPLEDTKLIERAAELAVVVALFSAGIRLDRRLSWRGWSSTVRLIAVAMPLTIGLVAVLGNVLVGLSWGAAIVLGAALAPTDPVLAGEIQVGPPGEGGEEEPRFALTSEAGLNDGLAFPFIFLGLLVADSEGPSLANWLAADVAYAIVAGTLVGALAGWGLAAATPFLVAYKTRPLAALWSSGRVRAGECDRTNPAAVSLYADRPLPRGLRLDADDIDRLAQRIGALNVGRSWAYAHADELVTAYCFSEIHATSS
jgi:sodium/hydrogen antiporter